MLLKNDPCLRNGTLKLFLSNFLAQKQMLPLIIRVDMNCQPTWVTQNAIPGEQELISLRGGHYDPPPLDKVGVKSDK